MLKKLFINTILASALVHSGCFGVSQYINCRKRGYNAMYTLYATISDIFLGLFCGTIYVAGMPIYLPVWALLCSTMPKK